MTPEDAIEAAREILDGETFDASSRDYKAVIAKLLEDAERIDFLGSLDQWIANVQLPQECIERNMHSLRDAIDDAMRMHKKC